MATKSEEMNKTNGTPAENNGAANTGNQNNPPAGNGKEVKEGWFARKRRAVREWCSAHPGWTAFGGAAVGSGVTVAAGYGGKKLMEKHQAKTQQQAYIPQTEENSLDPNL